MYLLAAVDKSGMLALVCLVYNSGWKTCVRANYIFRLFHDKQTNKKKLNLLFLSLVLKLQNRIESFVAFNNHYVNVLRHTLTITNTKRKTSLRSFCLLYTRETSPSVHIQQYFLLLFTLPERA